MKFLALRNRDFHYVIDLPLIHQPIKVILRDDNCLENMVLTETLSNNSNSWKMKYGIMSSMKTFKALNNTHIYRTFSSAGGSSLVNYLPYSISYLLGNVSALPTLYLQSQVTKKLSAEDLTCTTNRSHNDILGLQDSGYPFIFKFYAFIRKHMAFAPYNFTLLQNDPLRRLSPSCRLQVEVYHFLDWLVSSESAANMLISYGLCQIKNGYTTAHLAEISCLDRQNLTVTAEKIVKEKMREGEYIWEDDEDAGKNLNQIFITLCATIAILIIVSIILIRYFCAHHQAISEYIIDIEHMEPSSTSANTQVSQSACKMKNTAFLEYALGSSSEQRTLNSITNVKNPRKITTNTWVYADSILSIAPVSRRYKSKEVLLKPTNLASSSIRFIGKRRAKFQQYTEVDHENVQRFYGLAKFSASKGRLKRNYLLHQLEKIRKTQQEENAMTQGYSESDFILPWIYYIIVEPCVRGSLFELLHSGQFEISKPMKLTLASDIASGMAYLHSKKIVHGRLSSLTCLLDSKWVVKIARWQHIRELAQTDYNDSKTNTFRGISRHRLKVSWHPEYLRLVWKSPAQLKSIIAVHKNGVLPTLHHGDHTGLMEHVFTKRSRGETRKNKTVEKMEAGHDVSEIENEYRSKACDVYSFGVIMTEIWSLEVPFQTALSVYQQEYQLAEAICKNTYKLPISINMPLKVGKYV